MVGVLTPFNKDCVFGGGKQDWLVNLKKQILFFFTKQINQRYLGSWCIKGTEEYTQGKDYFFLLMLHYWRMIYALCHTLLCTSVRTNNSTRARLGWTFVVLSTLTSIRRHCLLECRNVYWMLAIFLVKKSAISDHRCAFFFDQNVTQWTSMKAVVMLQ